MSGVCVRQFVTAARPYGQLLVSSILLVNGVEEAFLDRRKKYPPSRVDIVRNYVYVV